MKLLLKPLYIISLALYFLYDLFSSTLQVAWDVLTPRHRAEPKLILLPIDGKTDAEIMATANLISLTPGTMAMDVSQDRTHILVHAMFGARDAEATKQGLKNGIEKRLLRVMR